MGFGGKQPEMREIESEEYLGPFGHKLTLAVTAFHSMFFATSDVDPFWMSTAES
jgi:hypothetical protein